MSNLEKAKSALLEQMQTDNQWRNYYQDIIQYLKHEYKLADSEASKLYSAMNEHLKS